MKTWHHVILWLLIGYAVGWYWPRIGDMTLGRVISK